MIPLEFTLTAMRRSPILRATLASFTTNLAGVDFGESTLYLNVDPLPADGSTESVVAVAREFFGTVVVNTPAEPNFPAAVKWCWSQPKGEYFFGLEDDWLVLHPVSVSAMAAQLGADPPLSVVNLRAYRHDDDRICLAPGLWRTAHARAIAGRMRTDANPERQLRKRGPSNPHGGLHDGFKGKQFPEGLIVLRDLGRQWMSENGMRREGDRMFVRWCSKARTLSKVS